MVAAGGGAFLLLQRRTGILASAHSDTGAGLDDTGVAHLRGIDTDLYDAVSDTATQDPTTPSGSSSGAIEWDEAIDGVLGGEPEPPPSPS
jgi:hypothetical protein